MCDRGGSSLPITVESLNEYAIQKEPECVYEGDESATSTLVVEKFGRIV